MVWEVFGLHTRKTKAVQLYIMYQGYHVKRDLFCVTVGFRTMWQ